MAVLKILVIDDEPGIRSGVSRILRDFHVTYPFIELYHGTIKVESFPDVGTTFTVRLPKNPKTIT